MGDLIMLFLILEVFAIAIVFDFFYNVENFTPFWFALACSQVVVFCVGLGVHFFYIDVTLKKKQKKEKEFVPPEPEVELDRDLDNK